MMKASHETPSSSESLVSAYTTVKPAAPSKPEIGARNVAAAATCRSVKRRCATKNVFAPSSPRWASTTATAAAVMGR